MKQIKRGIYLKTNEFFKKIYLHDSLMENITFDGTKLTLDIDLCRWMQNNYRPSDDEIKRIQVIFYNVTCFNLDGKKEVDSDTILNFSIVKEESSRSSPLIKIVFGDGSDIKIISFRSDIVDFN